MTNREAQEIIRMIENNWRIDLGTARGWWRQALIRYDPELGTRAAARLAETSKFPPSLDDLLSVIRMLKPSERTQIERESGETQRDYNKRALSELKSNLWPESSGEENAVDQSAEGEVREDDSTRIHGATG